MKVVALVSGGKDSCYNMLLCQKHGHEIVALANLLPEAAGVDELDSFCFQTVGHNAVAAYATCCALPLFRRRFSGIAKSQDLLYSPTKGDEVEDLYCLLAAVKARMPEVQGVSSGAIASDYQRLRVEDVCSRLGLVSLAYMWHSPQTKLLREMCSSGIEAVLIKVAALGLDPHRHLGKTLSEMEPHMARLRERFDVNPCGEGGEYETLTLDCPLFTQARIRLGDTQVVLHSEGDPLQGGMLRIDSFHLEAKHGCSLAAAEVIDVTSDAGGEAPDCAGHGSPGWLSEATEPGRALVSADFVRRGDSYWHLLCSLSVADQQALTDVNTSDFEQMFAAAAAALRSAGLTWGDATCCNLYLTSMDLFGSINGVYNRYVTQKGPPSRACVELSLPDRQVLQLDVLLRAPWPPAGDGPASPLPGRRTLHVQSVSEWAPPCIGPYSQGVVAGGVVFMAGQISLDPPSMQIVPGGLQAEVRQALQNCQSAAVALKTSITTALLSMTSIISERAGKEAPLTVSSEINALSWGKQLGACGDEQEDQEEEEEEERLDAYLTPPDLPAPHWEALLMHVVVPRLPKEALVEFLPFATADDEELRAALRSGQLDGASSGVPWGVGWVGAAGRLLVCRAFLPAAALPAGATASGDAIDALVAQVIEALRKVVACHDLTWSDVGALRINHTPHPAAVLLSQRISAATAAPAERQSERERAAAVSTCGAALVPVLQLGQSAGRMDDAVAVELLAMRLSAANPGSPLP